MQILAYFDIRHEGRAINSLDFHPSGRKIVTAAHGAETFSGEVKIWDVSSVNRPKTAISCLGIVNFQFGINCVRWSPSGREIAVADDGHAVTVLRLQSRSRDADGNVVEIYRHLHYVTAHHLEVLHVEWSPTGAMLASTSIDGTARIWSVKGRIRCVAILDEAKGGHREAVKGCAWDPVGRLFATQSGDRTVKIWKTDSWTLAFTCSEPFVGSSQATTFTRLDWSPDGSVLIVPAAVNNSGPTAQIIMRRDFSFKKDLVGHRKPVGCVAFCKQMRVFSDSQNRKSFGYIVAIGGRDRTLSVWSLPRARRPVVVITDIVKHSITDMKWNNRTLAICSQDGSTRLIVFKESEIGTAVSDADLNVHCSKLYGCPLPGQVLADSNLDGGSELADLDEADRWSRKIFELAAPEPRKPKPTTTDVVSKPAATPTPPPVPAPKPAPVQPEPLPAAVAAPSFAQRGETLPANRKPKKRIVTTFLGAPETVEEPVAKRLKVSDSGETVSTTVEGSVADAKIEDDADLKQYLRSMKFPYDKKTTSRFIYHPSDDIKSLLKPSESATTSKVPPYFGLTDVSLDDPSSNRVIVTNETVCGTLHKVFRVWNLSSSTSEMTIVGENALFGDLNQHYVIVVTASGKVYSINRRNGIHSVLVSYPSPPLRIQVIGGFMFVLTSEQKFDFFSIATGKKLLTATVDAFTDSLMNAQLTVFKDQPLIALPSGATFTIRDTFWRRIEHSERPSITAKIPRWLATRNEALAINLEGLLSKCVPRHKSSVNAIVPSSKLAPALTLSGERKLYAFITKAVICSMPLSCQHECQANASDACPICSLFSLISQLSALSS
uniref:Protein HIRA n=1 Tax=Panagrellus redivivus TaxID=6233 RepID=A0A7E4VUD2_PANRE